MIPEILTLLLPVGKYILASTLMVLFYLLFYRGKTSYDLSRKYLVSIAIAALLLSQFHIIVSTPPVKIVKVEAAEEILKSSQSILTVSKEKPIDGNLSSPVLSRSFPQAAQSVSQKSQDDNSLKTKLIDFLTVSNTLLLIYGLVTLILIISFILQYFKIISMKRKGVVREGDGFEIVESADIPTPFSFCKTIFVGQNLTGNKRDVVIKHEQWHIRHHHYVDVMVMETLVRLFWFNPLLWWVRKELRNISEYQTDRSVLDEGHELYKYQTIILEEVMEQNPYLANGFNNSFTKKRFIRMKNTIQARFTVLRRISILPFLMGVFCLLCFTEGKGETRYVMNTTEELQPKLLNLDPDKKISNIEWKMDDFGKMNETDIDKSILESSEKIRKAITELEMANKTDNPEIKKKNLIAAFNALDINFGHQGENREVISDDVCETITKDDITLSLKSLKESLAMLNNLKSEKSQTIKAKTLANVILNTLKDGLINKIFTAQFENVRSQLQSLMTPLVDQMTDVMQPINQNQDIYQAENPKPSVSAEDQTQTQKKKYTLKPEQIKLSYTPYNSETSIKGIIRNKKETKVILAIPFFNSNSSFSIGSFFSIIDTKTQDRYVIRSVENDIPLETTICVNGLNKKMLEVVLIFPPLKKSVEVVNIIDFADGFIQKEVANDPWAFWNIPISAYLVETKNSAVYK